MVKSLCSIGAAILLLLGATLLEWHFVNEKFGGFEEELRTLYYKTEDGSANGEDAKAVQASWEQKKKIFTSGSPTTTFRASTTICPKRCVWLPRRNSHWRSPSWKF